jgi:hypothetical protein
MILSIRIRIANYPQQVGTCWLTGRIMVGLGCLRKPAGLQQ